MTDKQKEALDIIIREYSSLNINKDEFYTLMDFIIEEKQSYVPWTTPHPWTQPYYTSTGGTTNDKPEEVDDDKRQMLADNIALQTELVVTKNQLEEAKKQIDKLKMDVSPF